MLEYPVVVVARKFVDEHLGDVQGPFQPSVLPGYVGDDQVGLDRVHARVAATVGLGFRELPVPRVEAHVRLVVPELRVGYPERLVQ